MNQHFMTDLIPAELKGISNVDFGWRVGLWMTIIAIGIYASSSDSIMLVAFGIFCLGFGIAHGVELSHQALHNTGFTNSKLNELFGVMMGLPLLVSFYEYRISHLAHHKYVGTDDDTEYFDYGEGKLTGFRFLGILSMWPHYLRFCENFIKFSSGQPIPGFRERSQPTLRRYYKIVILSVMLLAIAGILSGSGARPLLTWLVAMFFVAGPIHALIEFPEHYKCDAQTKNTLHNTRSIRTNRFMTWFVNGNNFHVEHHMHPSIPLQNADRVHQILHPEHRFYNRGYLSFYRSIFS